MNIKSILLGTAAALASVPAALAADLPTEPTPEAVDYVKVCDAYGKGFFYIPGQETCFAIDGRVKASATISEDSSSLSVSGRVGFDARTATEYGTLRSYFRVKTDDSSIVLDKAYGQLGYVTFGYTGDLHDDYGGLFGENDYGHFGATKLGTKVLVDDLGGGFFVGAGVYIDSDTGKKLTASLENDLTGEVAFGIAGQSWGDVNAVIGYAESTEAVTAELNAKFKVTAEATVKTTVAYDEAKDETYLGLGGAYKLSDTFTPYLTGEYAIDAESFSVTAGLETSALGLTFLSEVAYDQADDDVTGTLVLKRSW